MTDEQLRGIGMTSQRARDRLIECLRRMGIESEAVLAAMRQVPRHVFVDEALASRAYENTALPIGYSQTISQPYIVARMTEALLEAGPLDRVLEIGAGCGYQTAILAALARQVYAVERLKALADRLRERMFVLRIDNVSVRHGDGGEGWPGSGPFDGILVAAAPSAVPEALLEQLAMGGRLVIPLDREQAQELVLFQRQGRGIKQTVLDEVKFVPLLKGVG